MQRTVKIVFNGEIRRIPLKDDATLASLRQLCAEMFTLKNPNFQLHYVDEEGDKIILSTIEELRALIDKSGGIFKLTLERAVPKAKPVQAPTSVAVPDAPLTKVVIEEKKEVVQAPVEEKKPRTLQEKKKAFKGKIASTKIVRLRWKEIQEGGPVKGCFIGANFKGKVHLKAARGRKSVWFLHETKDGDIVLAPLSAHLRHLRVNRNDAKINLNKGGAGDLARWSILRNGEKISLAELNHRDNIQLVSKARPDLVLSAGSFFKKNKIQAGLTTSPKDGAAVEGNTFTTSFGIEIVDPTKMLVKVVKNQKCKKQLIEEAHEHKKLNRRGGPFLSSQDFAALPLNKDKPFNEQKQKMCKKMEKRLKKMEKKRMSFYQI